MIWESSTWKGELLQDLKAIRDLVQQVNFSESGPPFVQTMIAIEKFAFVSAYVIRKLSEAHKISDELEAAVFPVLRFQRVKPERPIHLFNWHRFEEFYDLNAPVEKTMTLRQLCNMFIHSFIFCPAVDEDSSQFDTILFNSDHTKDDALFEIKLETLFELVSSVIQDRIEGIRFGSGGIVEKSRTSRDYYDPGTQQNQT